MTFEDEIKNYLQDLKKALDVLDIASLEKAVGLVMEAYKNGNRVYILGNGGSASTASHMVCDLGKGTLARSYDVKERRLKVFSLTDNLSLLTAYANDVSFESIFSLQLVNVVEKGDLVIALSGSGNSKNIINALRYAKKCKAKTIGLLGKKSGGKTSSLVDCAIIVQSNHYGPIEDIHMVLGHILAFCFSMAKMEYDGTGISMNKHTPYKLIKARKKNTRRVHIIS